MYFSKETLATNSRLGGHWSELWANRNMWNLQNDSIIAATTVTVNRVATGSAQIIINTEDGNFVAVHTVTVT